MDYPTYAEAQALAELPAESYTSKHGNELTARLMDGDCEPDEETFHDSRGWCGFYAFDDVRSADTVANAGAAIVWEHDDGRVTLEEFGDYSDVYAAWQAHYLTRWDDDTTDDPETTE